MCEIYSNLTINVPEWRHWHIFIATFEHISRLFLVFIFVNFEQRKVCRVEIPVFSVSVSIRVVELVKVGFSSARFPVIVLFEYFYCKFFEFLQCNMKLWKAGVWLITNVVGHIYYFLWQKHKLQIYNRCVINI